MTGNPNHSWKKGQVGRCRHHTYLYARRRTFFLVRTSQCTIHSLIRTLPMLSHRHWLKIQGISVAHFSKPLSSLRHVLVTCAFCSFPSCRSISYLFSVTTFSVDHIIGEDQIKPLFLCSLEWNCWLLGQSDSKQRRGPCDFNVVRGGPCDGREGSGRLAGCPTSAGKRERKRHTGSEVTYVVGHPIDVCLVTEAAPRTPQNGQLTELGISGCIAENLHCFN